MQSVTVICFYTLNTPYQQEVIHLKNSCSHFGIPIEVEGVDSKGTWAANIALKPRFILKKLREIKGPILWVDADAVFLQKPDFSLFLESDISVRFNEVFAEKRELAINGGTIFINQTSKAKKFIERWVERCDQLNQKEYIPFVDQIGLYDVLQEQREAKIFPLPISYCKIFDIDTFFIDDEDVVIEHRQASRQCK